MKKRRVPTSRTIRKAVENPLEQAILETVDALVVVLDRNGRIVLFNRACEQATGFTPDEMVGTPIWERLIPEDERDGVRKVFKNLVAGELPSRHENDWVCRDGSRRRIYWSNAVVRNARGEVRQVIGTGLDVTATRQLQAERQESEATMRAILQTAADGILTIDERGLVQTLNPAAVRLFGYSPSEVVGRNISMLMPSPYRDEHDGYLRNYLRTGEKKIIGIGREVRGRHKDGATFPLYVSVGETKVRGRRVFVGVVHDLTEIKRKEEELLRSRTLAVMGESAAAIAHEIKNPLAAISGPLQVLRDGLAMDDPRREIMEEVVSQIGRLDGTVHQLLVLAKPWDPKREPTDLGGVARRVVELSRGQASFERVKVDVVAPKGVTADVDPNLVEQVLWNLVLNAAEAIDGGGEVRIGIEEMPDAACIKVSDDGAGIPDEVRERLFQPFFTTKEKGNGLGLAVCRKILDAHGGALDVRSTPGKGTTVTLTFPRRP